jgi:iron complex outermembrane receptor protein
MTFKQKPIASAIALALLGSVANAQAQQTPPATQLDTITVTGIRASMEKSLEAKRAADAMVEVITAEDIGKMPDKNVADAVQRVPGVTISSQSGGSGGFDENDRVSMRGTNPRSRRPWSTATRSPRATGSCWTRSASSAAA